MDRSGDYRYGSCCQVMIRKNERITVDELHKRRTKTADIVKITGFKPTSVYRTVKLFKETGGIADSPRKGRSTTSPTPQNIKEIRSEFNEIRGVRCAKWQKSSGSASGASKTLTKTS
ncbi:hypothetical protein KIN20_032749 [Parelaphostrongylus tenuis]|uniref:Uncharacterized protein n=1 Tax=Parelaphostrongylus tenuis TaxID=148309 RepID=A0AAD5R7N7_PARTN|nr:hypothetical protein KIN20_032749 [Parelaphostrongylus tenuis]